MHCQFVSLNNRVYFKTYTVSNVQILCNVSILHENGQKQAVLNYEKNLNQFVSKNSLVTVIKWLYSVSQFVYPHDQIPGISGQDLEGKWLHF